MYSTVYEHCSLTLITLNISSTVYDAGKLMSSHCVGSVLVTRENSVVGIFTERDFMKAVIYAPQSPQNEPLEHWLSEKIIQIEKNASLFDAITLMMEKGIRRLVVKDKETIIGIASIRDLLAGIQNELSRMAEFTK